MLFLPVWSWVKKNLKQGSQILSHAQTYMQCNQREPNSSRSPPLLPNPHSIISNFSAGSSFSRSDALKIHDNSPPKTVKSLQKADIHPTMVWMKAFFIDKATERLSLSLSLSLSKLAWNPNKSHSQVEQDVPPLSPTSAPKSNPINCNPAMEQTHAEKAKPSTNCLYFLSKALSPTFFPLLVVAFGKGWQWPWKKMKNGLFLSCLVRVCVFYSVGPT